MHVLPADGLAHLSGRVSESPVVVLAAAADAPAGPRWLNDRSSVLFAAPALFFGLLVIPMRLLSKRVRQVREPENPEEFDEYGDRLPPPFE